MKKPNFNALYRVGDIVRPEAMEGTGIVIEVLVVNSINSSVYVVQPLFGGDNKLYAEENLRLVRSYTDIRRIVDPYGE